MLYTCAYLKIQTLKFTLEFYLFFTSYIIFTYNYFGLSNTNILVAWSLLKIVHACLIYRCKGIRSGNLLECKVFTYRS